nr:RNA 2'-phosphotransferase [Actinomycetospora corticicola]
MSKRMSRALRHEPARIGIELDDEGWTSVEALVAVLGVTRADVEDVVHHGSKPRYELDGGRIRARYGHSVAGRVELPVADPPAVLFHGTGPTTAGAVREEGLRPMGRQYVHLSGDEATARQVGARHGGVPVVFVVDAAAAAEAGVVFRRGNDDTWLVAGIGPEFLSAR